MAYRNSREENGHKGNWTSQNNAGADRWRYKIGVNVIPADTKNKTTNSHWKQYQNSPIPKSQHEQWIKDNAFANGMAVMPGRTWHRRDEIGQYLICLDADKREAIDEICTRNGKTISLQELAQKFLVEQHKDNPDKAHIYFYSPIPFPKKSADSTLGLEVKGLGEHGIVFCSPSIHKDRFPYEIIGTLKPIALKVTQARELIQHINQICIKYGLHYLDKVSTFDGSLKDMIKSLTINHTIKIPQGQRHITLISLGILRVTESTGLNSRKASEFLETLVKNGNKWRDEVVDTFLEDYKGTRYILDNLPKGYSYKHRPKLMQAYVAYKILRKKYFLNLSGVGAGKTLSAILASRVVNCKMTVIICPKDIVDQWETTIKKVFPDSIVYTSMDPVDEGIGKKAFHIKRKESRHQYIVINYDKFSLQDSRELILDLTNQKIDFVILDEIHFAKKRGDDNPRYRHNITLRNTNLNLFRSQVKKQNKNVRVLGMTATPVINDLTECRSLIELVTGKDYHDELSTNPTIRNAVAFYGKLQIMSIRELPDYHVTTERQEVDVNAHTDEDTLELIRNPLKLEQILTEARMPEIINRISRDSKTIIYTEYVDEILQRLREEVKKAGFTFTEYTGIYKELTSFVDGKAQVLIASKPIAVGVEGLQDVCDNLIINTLPWTNAHYQQLVGRLVRRGQPKNSVKVHIIKASINDYPYDEQLKWYRIRWKRSLGDCVTDGIMPLKNLVSIAEASKELKNWLERMNRNEITTIERKDINVELTPQEIKQRTRVFGDLSNMNKQYNKSRSEINHIRIQENPMYLVEYHRQMREAKNDWGGIIPVEIIADKIKGLRLPSRFIDKLVIGDFGCGECELSSILSKNKTYSFDHHNILNEEKIIPCDIKDTSQYLKDNSIDVAVFSLSLMATNWPDYIKEARRVLDDRGYLFIAEVTRSLSAKGSLFSNEEGRLYKLRELLEKEGFEIISDKPKGKFTFIDAQKR